MPILLVEMSAMRISRTSIKAKDEGIHSNGSNKN